MKIKRRAYEKSKPASPFRYFNSAPEVILTAAMLYIRYPLRNVEDGRCQGNFWGERFSLRSGPMDLG
jgi:hypothetical protein